MAVFDRPRETYDLTYDDVRYISRIITDFTQTGRGRVEQRGEAESEDPIFGTISLWKRRRGRALLHFISDNLC